MNELFGVEFLGHEFPLKDRSHFVPAIERAYSLVNQLYAEHEFLNWAVGKDIRPYIRNVAVEFEIKRLIESGKVQLDYRLAKNKSGNYNHLEVISQNCILTVHHIPNINKNKLPRPAVYRQNLCRNNQISLFQIPESGLYEKYDSNYALLVHNSRLGDVAGASLVLPNDEMNTQISRIDLLNEVKQHLGLIEMKVDDDLKLEFKEFVEKRRVSTK